MSHKFSVGQLVELAPRVYQAAARGHYEIRRLMPSLESDPGDPVYCIKSVEEHHERVALESNLTLAKA